MALAELKRSIRAGGVYRRSDLDLLSNAVDRHLRQLVDAGDLVKVAGGLYMKPRKTKFGFVGPKPKKLVEAFLGDDNFLMFSPNAYNDLGVGTTQLFNETFVYNHKRHGRFELAGQKFYFRHDRPFPKKLSREFLLVDLVNNLRSLPEDYDEVLEGVLEQVQKFNPSVFEKALESYGTVRTRKLFSKHRNRVAG
ncbi:MAG: hypothetical protein EX271_05050 [Acidimicrobiales bacterium]|nr:MAG: hypothetical protein EX271_05050 [Acidimicrobiales bacterium]